LSVLIAFFIILLLMYSHTNLGCDLCESSGCYLCE